MSTIQELTGLTAEQIHAKQRAMRDDPRTLNPAGFLDDEVAAWCCRLQRDDTAMVCRPDANNGLTMAVAMGLMTGTVDHLGMLECRTNEAGKRYAEVFRPYWQNGFYFWEWSTKDGKHLPSWPGMPDPYAG